MKLFNTPFPIVAFTAFFILLALCLLVKADETLFLELNRGSQIIPGSIWGSLTTLSDPMTAPLLVFTMYYRNQLFLRAFFIALILAVIGNYSLKYGFGFERPPLILDHSLFNLIGPIPTSPSFPSGHTITLFSLIGLISVWYQKRTVSIAIIILASIISFSRISVGAHWPSDVLFGALIGCFIGWVALEVNTRLNQKIAPNLALAAYFITLFCGIFSLISKTPYPSGQWLSTAVAMFAIAYSLKAITELLHRQKG